jgi:hypothetical protein
MHPGQPIDPATHVSYIRLTWTLIQRIQTVLRPDEINDCAAQFYEDIRAHFQQQRSERQPVPPAQHPEDSP